MTAALGQVYVADMLDTPSPSAPSDPLTKIGQFLSGLTSRFRPSPRNTAVLKGLLPYVWPKDRPDLQRTVMISLGLMLAAKLVTVMMPFTYKWATDALVAASGGKVIAGRDDLVHRAPRSWRPCFTASCASP